MYATNWISLENRFIKRYLHRKSKRIVEFVYGDSAINDDKYFNC